MKFIYFFLFFLPYFLLSHRTHLKSTKQINDVDDATTSVSSENTTEDVVSTRTETTPTIEDLTGAFMNVMKDKNWVYSGTCPEKKKSQE